MLDQLFYDKSNEGRVIKATVSIPDKFNFANELAALEAQRVAFDTPADTPDKQAELDAAKTNYDEAITALKQLEKDPTIDPAILDDVVVP